MGYASSCNKGGCCAHLSMSSTLPPMTASSCATRGGALPACEQAQQLPLCALHAMPMFCIKRDCCSSLSVSLRSREHNWTRNCPRPFISPQPPSSLVHSRTGHHRTSIQTLCGCGPDAGKATRYTFGHNLNTTRLIFSCMQAPAATQAPSLSAAPPAADGHSSSILYRSPR